MYTSSHYLLSREILQCVETDKDTLAIMYGNRAIEWTCPFVDIPLKTSDIIDEYVWCHPRKLQQSNIFVD